MSKRVLYGTSVIVYDELNNIIYREIWDKINVTKNEIIRYLKKSKRIELKESDIITTKPFYVSVD